MSNRGRYVSIIDLALTDLRRTVRANTPSISGVNKLANIDSAILRNAEIKKMGDAFKAGYVANTKSILNENVSLMSHVAIEGQLPVLRKNGIILTPKELDSIKRNFAKSYGRKFKGKTAVQRARNIAKRTNKDVRKAIIDTRHGRKDIISKVIRNADDFGGRSLSAVRSGEVLIYSELNRAQNEMVVFLAESIGAKYVRWVNTGRPESVCDICKEYANSINVTPLELPNVSDMRGIFHIDNVPEYPHSCCKCELMIIDSPYNFENA